jgi:alpha-galactosidase
MGWDSWGSFGCGVNEAEVKRAARALVASGMRDAGYRYVIIDDCWYEPARRADGSLRADPRKFPSGMRALGRYLHARGLLFGIYESPGSQTCAQVNGLYPGSTGSLGHEWQDAKTFASWRVDYLKYDYCSPGGTLRHQIRVFTEMRHALRATGRPIVYSINPNSFHVATGASYDWLRIANLVRVSRDLAPIWDTGRFDNWYMGIANTIAVDARLARRARPGYWNDPDELVVGVPGPRYAAKVGSPGLDALISPLLKRARRVPSLEQMRTNFAMWAMMAAPLIAGCDVRYLSRSALSILLNRRLIAIDQDPLGRQGRPIRADEEVWAKRLSRGAVGAALFNPTSVPITITTTARKLGLPSSSRYTVWNLWTGRESATRGVLRARVPAHEAALFRLVAKPRHPPHR